MEHKSENRICQNHRLGGASCQKEFTIESEDFSFYEKIKVPPPSFCPECRLQRRMSWRNERSLYKRECIFCGKNILSMYNPNRKHIIYCHDCWWGDKWNPISFGSEYDFSKMFFEQYSDLLKRTPLLTLSNLNSVNSEYANFTDDNKNCYLVFRSGWNENVQYARMSIQNKDSVDLLNVWKSELMYECTNCHESYALRYSLNCKNCTDSFFLYNCRNCSNCFGCVNLISKSYCIFNVQYTKEEYNKRISEMNCSSWKNKKKIESGQIQKLLLSGIYKYANIVGSTGCTGDSIDLSKNSKNCFDISKNCENIILLQPILRITMTRLVNLRTIFLMSVLIMMWGTQTNLQ